MMPDDTHQDYSTRIQAIHRELGIAPDYARRRGLVLEPECRDPVTAGEDMFARPVWMEAAALDAWRTMRGAALDAGIELQLVSAFRSAQYQKELFLRKMARGQTLEDILRVNAAPGYSEHHSGQALDLGCAGYPCLEEAFEDSPAFAWLVENGRRFGFSLSFPRDNPQGFLYEPWHWRYRQAF